MAVVSRVAKDRYTQCSPTVAESGFDVRSYLITARPNRWPDRHPKCRWTTTKSGLHRFDQAARYLEDSTPPTSVGNANCWTVRIVGHDGNAIGKTKPEG